MDAKLNEKPEIVAFADATRIATGDLAEVALAAKRFIDGGSNANVLLFDFATSEAVEVDFRGTEKQMLARLPRQRGQKPRIEAQRGPGRPKLGVVAREVTLLPRHWEWLGKQQGGASVAMRKLVEQARKSNAKSEEIRQAREVSYRFMSTMAGDLPGFEEATRALFGNDAGKWKSLIRKWPPDLANHLRRLTETVFPT